MAYEKKKFTMNLLEETIWQLHQNGKSEQDVRWVGVPKMGSMTWEEFKQLADEYYDDGYGTIYVNSFLVVVGDDWWLERHSRDGAEWWEFKTLPEKPPHEEFEKYEENKDFLFVFNEVLKIEKEGKMPYEIMKDGKTRVICDVCGKEKIIPNWGVDPIDHIEGVFLNDFICKGKGFTAWLTIYEEGKYRPIIICKECQEENKKTLLSKAVESILEKYVK